MGKKILSRSNIEKSNWIFLYYRIYMVQNVRLSHPTDFYYDDGAHPGRGNVYIGLAEATVHPAPPPIITMIMITV